MVNLTDQTNNKDIEISLDNISEDFESFLNTDNNKRIFFSGRFGIGKSFFIRKFFQAHKEKYENFHLFPVNYQINGNEDIVELLKYDLLVELKNKDNGIFTKIDITGLADYARVFYLWGQDNVVELAKYMTSFLPRLGRPVKETISISESFFKFANDVKSGEKGKIDKYISSLGSKNISATDYISSLIKDKVDKIKGHKESVLVLDDLDRIDPEHIFRILNVFSTHFNSDEENKFGFDRVIMVADYENIKNIFHYKYGHHTDFGGYSDKFFSIAPYDFNNNSAVLNSIDLIIKNIKNDEPDLKSAIGESGYIKLFLSDILKRTSSLEGSEKLNLRQLFKATDFRLPVLREGAYQRNTFNSPLRIIDIAIKVLIYILSGKRGSLLVLKKIRDSVDKEDDGNSVPYNFYSFHMLKDLGEIKLQSSDPANETLEWNGYVIDFNGSSIKAVGNNRDDITRFFYDALIDYISKDKYNKDHWEYRDR